MARLEFDRFDLDEEIDRLIGERKRVGAISTFVGVARDFARGEPVTRLEFEAYRSMALRELEKIERDATERFKLIDAVIVHRLGSIDVGAKIVLIIALAERRARVFQACSWMIDRLKERAPIWKKEFRPDGGFWVEDRP